MAEVTLEPIGDANRETALALRVAPGQEGFVSSVADSLAEAARYPGAHAQPFLVRAAGEPVGFVMVADEVEGDDFIPQYLWKLMIDARHQRRGHGTATLDRVVELFRGREAITTSAVPGDGGPLAFYERYGFERTGEEHDGEIVLRLRLFPQDAASSSSGS